MGNREGASSIPEVLRCGAWWSAVVAVGVYQLGIMLLNTSVFPLFNGVFLEARDVGSLFSAAFSLVLYLLVSNHPSWCNPKRWMLASAALFLVGAPTMLAGVWLASPALLTAGVLLRGVASSWYGTTLCLALVRLALTRGMRGVFGALCAGWALSYCLELVAAAAPLTAQLGAFFLSSFVVMALTYRSSAALIRQTVSCTPVAELRVTNPRSFLPWSSALFVAVVVLKASFGFAMTFSSVDATPQATVLACVPALLCALALLASNHVGLNALYKATMLFVLAGFLLAGLPGAASPDMPALANVVLRAGSDLSRMLVFMAVAGIGARNTVGALGVTLFMSGANSLGSVAGAQLGMLANTVLATDPGLFSLLLAGVVFAFVAYNVLIPDVFRLDETAGRIEAVQPPTQPAVPADVLATAAARLAGTHALTPREAEALELLAHGRNTAAIQERMCVSRSTAKTHVRNVYAKLGVHSQQDLIDLVERAAG